MPKEIFKPPLLYAQQLMGYSMSDLRIEVDVQSHAVLHSGEEGDNIRDLPEILRVICLCTPLRKSRKQFVVIVGELVRDHRSLVEGVERIGSWRKENIPLFEWVVPFQSN